MSYIPNSKGPREVSGRARGLVCGGADPAPGVEGASPIEPVAGTLASDRDGRAERACVDTAGTNGCGAWASQSGTGAGIGRPSWFGPEGAAATPCVDDGSRPGGAGGGAGRDVACPACVGAAVGGSLGSIRLRAISSCASIVSAGQGFIRIASMTSAGLFKMPFMRLRKMLATSFRTSAGDGTCTFVRSDAVARFDAVVRGATWSAAPGVIGTGV
jgi:hypothetical protein